MKNSIKSLIAGGLMVVFFASAAFTSAAMYLITGDSASTLAPTGVTTTSMTLRGNYNVNSTGTVQTWFEYGSSYDLVQSGAGQLIGNSSHDLPAGTFTYTWNNLTPNTTYYFRAVVAQNGHVSNGNILGMKTTNTVTPPPTYSPTLSSINPSSGYIGTNYTVTLSGANFTNGSTVNFGSGISINGVTYNSSTQLTANISISSSTSTGSRSVYVNNSNGTSNSLSFIVNSYNNDGCSSGNPTIYSISPNSITMPETVNQTIVISGYNFTYNATALWNGSSRPTYYNSSSQLTMTLYASDISNNSNGTVSVRNNNNCNNSNGMTLTIQNDHSCSYYGTCPPPSCYNCYSQTPSVTTLSSNVYGSSITFNGSVNPNSNTATVWFRYGTSSYGMTNETTHTYQGSGSWATNFNATINASQNVTYYYQAVANNAYGTVYGAVFSTTATNYNTPTVTTVIATNKTTGTARLNGIATGYATQGYFEYGETAALGNITPSKYIGVGNDVYSVNFSDTVYGLQPNTIYYFRAVASNTNGTARGNIFVFQTSNIYVPAPVDTTPSVTPATKNELIKITTNSENVYLGDNVEYFITYKNNTKKNFENTVITVQLPKEVIFDETNFGRLNKDNAVVFNINNLIASQVGSITIRGHINKESSGVSTIVTTAIMTYTVAGSTTEKNEIDFVTNNIVDGSSLAAASLFGAGFMPTTLIGWIALLLVILVLIALIRHLYLGYNNNTRPLV